MRYAVSYKCGHTAMTAVLGSEESRNKRIAQLETGDCSRCWTANQLPQFTLPTRAKGCRIYVKHGFAIREDLRARGYCFGTVTRSWTKNLATADEVEFELLWIGERGFELQELGKER